MHLTCWIQYQYLNHINHHRLCRWYERLAKNGSATFPFCRIFLLLTIYMINLLLTNSIIKLLGHSNWRAVSAWGSHTPSISIAGLLMLFDDRFCPLYYCNKIVEKFSWKCIDYTYTLQVFINAVDREKIQTNWLYCMMYVYPCNVKFVGFENIFFKLRCID